MSTDYLSALNAGSGLNVTQIVDALVDAERVPKQKQIDEASSICFCLGTRSASTSASTICVTFNPLPAFSALR